MQQGGGAVGREPSSSCPQLQNSASLATVCGCSCLSAYAHSCRQCRCGGRLDPLGDHRAACPTAGVLGARGAPLERAAARMCLEAGARVATNVLLRDVNVGLPLADSRRIEVLANGLPLWQGAEVAVDTTLVCPLTCSGETRPGTEREPGLALQTAANRKRRAVYPELLAAKRCELCPAAYPRRGGRERQTAWKPLVGGPDGTMTCRRKKVRENKKNGLGFAAPPRLTARPRLCG